MPASSDLPSVVLPGPGPALTDPAALAGSYQGLMTRTDGTDQWLRLVISDVSPAGDGARFKFTINSPQFRRNGEGMVSLQQKVVRLADLTGVVETRSDGYVVLRSSVRGLRPNWSLTSNRALSTRNTGGTE